MSAIPGPPAGATPTDLELLDAVLASAPAPQEDDEGEWQMQALPVATAGPV